jgi:hypothetical protein
MGEEETSNVVLADERGRIADAERVQLGAELSDAPQRDA